MLPENMSLQVFLSPLVQSRSSSFSGEYGGKGGKRFSHSGNQLDGPITAFRIRVNSNFIVGYESLCFCMLGSVEDLAKLESSH